MNQAPEYVAGIAAESEIIERLKAHPHFTGRTFRLPTVTENARDDIDVWIRTRDGAAWVGVSIKHQLKARETKRFAFEVEVMTAGGEWKPSWYVHTKARYFVISDGKHDYMMSVQYLQEFVERQGWDEMRTLAFATRQSQDAIGHSHKDARVGLLNLSTLLNEDIAFRL